MTEIRLYYKGERVTTDTYSELMAELGNPFEDAEISQEMYEVALTFLNDEETEAFIEEGEARLLSQVMAALYLGTYLEGHDEV